MKIDIRRDEHVRIANDSGVGFSIHIENGEVHIRAKSPDEPNADRTTIVHETKVELTK